MRVHSSDSDSVPSARETGARLQRLESRGWQILATAMSAVMLLTGGIAGLAFELQPRLDTPARQQLDIAVHCLLATVVLFAMFVVYEKVAADRLRQQWFGRILAAASEEN